MRCYSDMSFLAARTQPSPGNPVSGQQQSVPREVGCWSPVMAEIGWVQASPFQASIPSRSAQNAMTRPAIGSAHVQPKRLSSRRPTRTAAERYEQIRVGV